MVCAQPFAVARRRSSHPLRRPPNAPWARAYSQQQPRQPRRQRIRRHHGQPRQQTSQRAANAPRRPANPATKPALNAARRATVARNPRLETSRTSQPGHWPAILAAHGLSAMGACGRRCLGTVPAAASTPRCKLRQHARTVFLLHGALQRHELRRPARPTSVEPERLSRP
jgi:hypothetical protein